MQLKFKHWHIVGTILTIIAGTLLHFTYEWSGCSKVVALFSAVNESTWEHLKLLAIPMLILTIPEYLAYGKCFKHFFAVRTLCILIGMTAITTLFYTYSGVVGRDVASINIAIFVIGVCLAYYSSARLLKRKPPAKPLPRCIGLIGLALLALAFFLFTFYPPHIGLFQDPLTGGYGITASNATCS